MTIARLVLLADVSDREHFHVGDEAMLDANLANLRVLFPNASYTVITDAPSHIASEYHVNAVPRLPFSKEAAGTRDREQLLEIAIETAHRIQRGQEPEATTANTQAIRAIADSDGLLVSGGGNMSSEWPEHIYQHIALLRVAHIFEKPSIVLGQSIGPWLESGDRELLGRGLNSAQLVCTRDYTSFLQSLALGISQQRLLYSIDDAMLLDPMKDISHDLSRFERTAGRNQPFIGVTVHNLAHYGLGSTIYKRLAQQLEQLSDHTGAHIVFIPHAAARATHGLSDINIGQILRELFQRKDRFTTVEAMSPRNVKWITGQMDLVISTRLHPIVFALSSSVPCIGLYSDAYTRMKLKGAVAHAMLDQWVSSLSHSLDQLAQRASDMLLTHNKSQSYLKSLIPVWREAERQRWNRVFTALNAPVFNHAGQEPIRSYEEDYPVEVPEFTTQDLQGQPPESRQSEAGANSFPDLSNIIDSATDLPVSLPSTISVNLVAESTAILLQVSEERNRRWQAATEHAASISEVLAARDQELASVKSVLTAREEELAAVKAALGSKDGRLRAAEEYAASMSDVLEVRERELAALKALLESEEL